MLIILKIELKTAQTTCKSSFLFLKLFFEMKFILKVLYSSLRYYFIGTARSGPNLFGVHKSGSNLFGQ